MLRNKNSGFAFLIGILAIAALVIIAILILQFARPKPMVEVMYAIDPSTIKENERSKLTVTFKNVDLKTHEIAVAFEISPRISVYGGNEYLLQDNTYTFRLEATDSDERRVFTISGNLETGTISSQYLIHFSVYVDGDKLSQNWDTPILTIREP